MSPLSPTKSHSHPIFARLFARISRSEDKYGVTEHRRELLDRLAGRVVEVGAGSGLNFPHYPATVSEVIAVEPEPYLRRLAEQAAATASVPVEVIDGSAEQLPVEDHTFDAGVLSLVLCSVDDVDRALAELRRSIKPGGELRFYEHVAAEQGALRRVQHLLDHLWPRLFGGCHTAREAVAAIEQAGFEIDRCRRFSSRPCLLALPTSPQVIGSARNSVATREP